MKRLSPVLAETTEIFGAEHLLVRRARNRQVADDLLDYTEGQEMTGKPSGLDLKEHKVQ